LILEGLFQVYLNVIVKARSKGNFHTPATSMFTDSMRSTIPGLLEFQRASRLNVSWILQQGNVVPKEVRNQPCCKYGKKTAKMALAVPGGLFGQRFAQPMILNVVVLLRLSCRAAHALAATYQGALVLEGTSTGKMTLLFVVHACYRAID
jgi:hypothetical protein